METTKYKIYEARDEKGNILFYSIDHIKTSGSVADFWVSETLKISPEQAERNAKLFISAKETKKQRNKLLEACIDMVKLFEKHRFIDCEPKPGNFNLRINAARKAIKNTQ